MWNQIGIDDIPGLQRYVDMMKTMTWRMQGLTVNTIRSGMRRGLGELYEYQGEGFDIMLSFILRGRNYHVCGGMLGDITPEQTLRLMVDRGQAFMLDHGINELYTFDRPVSYPPLGRLLELLPQDPEVRVTVMGTEPALQLWKLEYIGQGTASSSRSTTNVNR